MKRKIVHELSARYVMPVLVGLCVCWSAACAESPLSTEASITVDGPIWDTKHADQASLDAATSGDLDAQSPPRFLSGPELLPNPNASVPLAAIVEFTTDQPVTAALEIRAGQEGRRVTFQAAATDFSLPVLGLEPEQTFSVEVLIEAGGHQVRAPTTLTGSTGPLPEWFPPLKTTVSQPDQMEPRRWAGPSQYDDRP